VASPNRKKRLVAVTSADGDLVTSLGATAAEDCCAGLRLHAAQEAVGLGAAATVGLKGTLRHGTNSSKWQESPADQIRLLQQLSIVPYRAGFSQGCLRARGKGRPHASLGTAEDRNRGERNEARKRITKSFRLMKILLIGLTNV
jgi:hypothetical protein